MKIVSRRRAEALPYGAVVLERLMLATDLKDVVISAYGLREGLLYARLSPEERAKDPLIEFADGRQCAPQPHARACRRNVRLDGAAVRRRERPNSAASARRPACSPTSAGAAIPTTARSAPSTRC